MNLRRVLLVLLGLWVGLGIVLAPARPMQGMDMSVASMSARKDTQRETSATMLEHAGHRNTGYRDTGHRDTRPNVGGQHSTALAKTALAETTSPDRPAAKPEPSGHDHLARCVLCVVGAGMLTLVVTVVRTSSPARAPTPKLRPFTQPTRFRHFRSRAPPAAFSS